MTHFEVSKPISNVWRAPGWPGVTRTARDPCLARSTKTKKVATIKEAQPYDHPTATTKVRSP